MFLTLFGVSLVTVGHASSTLTYVIDQYKTALQYLVKAHEQEHPVKAIDLTDNSLLSSTYASAIAPSVLWIQGYAQLISEEFNKGYAWQKDLSVLFEMFITQEKEVKLIVAVLPKAVQAQAWTVFYQNVGVSLVPICFEIIKNIAGQSQYDVDSLHAAKQAYLMAWKTQTDKIKILGCQSQADFANQLTTTMQSLFSQAIAQQQNLLQKGMVETSGLKDIYESIEQYAQMLVLICTNVQDTSGEAQWQNLIAQTKAQWQSYQQAVGYETQALQVIKTARDAIVLDVANATSVLAAVRASLQSLSQAANLYESASDAYQVALDLVGINRTQLQQNLINDYDLLVRFGQKLWCLYLIDQSAQGVYTFPTIASFAQGQATGQNANVVQALSNLSGMISSTYVSQNNMIGLTSSSQDLLITSLLQDAIAYGQEIATTAQITKMDPLFDIRLINQVNSLMATVDAWSNALVQALNNTTSALAQAMEYAQVLDQSFVKNSEIKQYFPFLPDAYAPNSKWTILTANILLQAGLVSSVDQAMKLVGKVTVQQPSIMTAQDLQALNKKATELFAHGQALEKLQHFSTASTAYQKAMNDYKILYVNASDAVTMVAMANQANVAESRFVALSFAGLVQSSGAAQFAGVSTIPTSFSARSYSISVNPTLLNNSLPTFLSTLITGQTMTTFSVEQKQDIAFLIKSYLIAVYLSGKGDSFSNYFSDYKLTMSASSSYASGLVAQISNYLNDFKNIGVVSVSLESDSSLQVNLSRFPIDFVQPWCSALASASELYASAALLLGSGSSLITIGGQSYYQGNDLITQKVMYEKEAYVYVAKAYQLYQVLNQSMQKLQTEAASAKKLSDEMMKAVRAVQDQALSVQAMLYQTKQSNAFSCFTQAGMPALAQLMYKEFLQLYSKQIDLFKKCLVGNPTVHNYRSLMRRINSIYISWASNVSDQAQVTKINQAIIALGQIALSAALKAKYIDPAFPGISQVHYMIAAAYAADMLKGYQAAQNAAQVQTTQTTLNQLFYKAAMQNISVYFEIKKSGVAYVPAEGGAAVTVSFNQLVLDFLNATENNATVDPNELLLYSKKVQPLLLDAAIVFEELGQSSSKTSKTDQAAGKNAVLKFLNQSNLVSTKLIDFTQIPLTAAVQVFALADKAWTKFSSNPPAFQAWNQLLFDMVKNQYIVDFISGDVSSVSEQQKASDTEQFLSAVKKEVTSFSNPASAYIG